MTSHWTLPLLREKSLLFRAGIVIEIRGHSLFSDRGMHRSIEGDLLSEIERGENQPFALG